MVIALAFHQDFARIMVENFCQRFFPSYAQPSICKENSHISFCTPQKAKKKLHQNYINKKAIFFKKSSHRPSRRLSSVNQGFELPALQRLHRLFLIA